MTSFNLFLVLKTQFSTCFFSKLRRLEPTLITVRVEAIIAGYLVSFVIAASLVTGTARLRHRVFGPV